MSSARQGIASQPLSSQVGSRPTTALAPLRVCVRSARSRSRWAIPVVAVLFMTQMALGFVSRAAPAMQIFSVGFAVTLVVGGAAIVIALPDIGREVIAELGRVGPRLEGVLLAVGRS